jgi:hypothetical protein
MNNITDFDSKEEWMFDLWIKELQSVGLINHSVYHPKPFLLSEKVNLTFEFQMATKTKLKDINLIADHDYQADWIIYWSEKAVSIMFAGRFPLTQSPKDFPFFSQWSAKRNLFYTVIDIKGSFSGPHNNSAITFPLNQKWVYQKYRIYVQKIVLIPRITKTGKLIPSNTLFAKTFLPRRMITTDTSGESRKINFKYIFLEEFLKNNGLR